jgi:hypothetical protein
MSYFVLYFVIGFFLIGWHFEDFKESRDATDMFLEEK